MSSSGSSNLPLRNDDDASSEASIAPKYTRLKKNPYIPWYIVPEKKLRSPSIKYWPGNDEYFTLQVSHGGSLIDRPGKKYRRSIVTYFEAVNLKRLDLDELRLMSRRLGYPTMGKWFCMPDENDLSLDLIPLRTEAQVASFRERIKHNNRCLKIEKVFVEHGDPSEYLVLPKDVMESEERRLEKVVYLLLLENPTASVDDGVEEVLRMTGVTLSREKMENALNQARKQLKIWW